MGLRYGALRIDKHQITGNACMRRDFPFAAYDLAMGHRNPHTARRRVSCAKDISVHVEGKSQSDKVS